jgi:hypothetical protein
MAEYSVEKRYCWCGILLGTPGHPEPHHHPTPRPPTPSQEHGSAHHMEHPASHHQERCSCSCHTHEVDVHVHITAEPTCPHCHHAKGDTGQGQPGQTGKGDPTGKIPDPPPGAANDPWDIIQIIIKTCNGETPPPRKDSFLPYIVVRANPADRGQRPLPNGTCFWESPDIFVMPNQSVSSAPDVPATLGGMAQAGAPNTIFAHVWNLGRGPAFDVRVEFYWFNPTLGIEEADANLIGFTYVTLGNRNSPRSHAIVRCPVDWVPTFLNNGHECLVVRAFAPISDPLGSAQWSASLNRHVAQRNIAVLRGPQQQTQPVQLNVAPGHSVHDAQVTVTTLSPDKVPWMQLLTGKRNPGLTAPGVSPVVGLTPPAAALEAGSLGLNVGGLSTDALAQLLSTRYQFKRSTDPMAVSLIARAPQLAANEAHVVRVQQIHENQLVGGYTVIVLP